LEGDRNLEQTWARIQEHLRATFSDSVYEAWFSALRPVEVRGNALVVEAPPRTRDWVGRRFGSVLTAAAGAADPSLRRVELVAEGQRREPTHDRDAGRHADSLPSLRIKHSFSTFVIGPGSRFAHAAALAVAEMPGQAYNPLILFGPAGVGKTHLLQAIGTYVRDNDPAASIHYATVETFTNNFTSALRTDTIHSFKRTYRQCDLLLLDDVQFLDGKARTAEEFFHTLDCATTAGAQVVLTVDRHPSKLPLLESRLRERLQGGLAVDIHPADRLTRIAILRKLAAENPSLELDGDILSSVASRIGPNVHVLAGALTRLTAYASLTGSKVTISLVEEVLTNLYGENENQHRHERSSQPTVNQIQTKTAAAFDLDQTQFISPGRGRRLVYARQIAMYLCRELTTLSLPAIADQFGGRDHTTVLHAHRKIKNLILTDESTRDLVSSLATSFTHARQPTSQDPQELPQAPPGQ
jgi:chromosomal replication initiator protein